VEIETISTSALGAPPSMRRAADRAPRPAHPPAGGQPAQAAQLDLGQATG
jgi:hypothetical protein